MAYHTLCSKLKNIDTIVAFDLEATQYSHKAIAIGVAVFALDKSSFPYALTLLDTYYSLIYTTDSIGAVVEDLTGIHQSDLEGANSFHRVVVEVGNFLRPYKNKLYMSYGSFDMRILFDTVNPQDETEENFLQMIRNHYLDFGTYLDARIMVENGGSFSVEALTELYHIQQVGAFHNPTYDAIYLARIFEEYMKQRELTLSLMKKNLLSHKKALSCIAPKIIETIQKDGYIDNKKYEELLEDYL